MPKETLINIIFRLAGNLVAEHQPWFDKLTNRIFCIGTDPESSSG